jgi:hypothetical protein
VQLKEPVKLDFSLHPRQWAVVHSGANEQLFGGALMAGKSYLCRALALAHATAIPGLQIYVLRREWQDLIDTHFKGPSSFGVMAAGLINAGLCKLTQTDLEFWNNSRIHGSHFQLERDFTKFEGAEIHMLLVDELTHFSFAQYEALKRRCRLGSFRVPEKYQQKFPWILCTGTPGGIGHSWVKEYFVDAGDMVMREIAGMRRQYIAAQITDNPTALANDPSYLEKLASESDPVSVAAKLRGDWNVVAGSMFVPPWNRSKHVCAPFPIPLDWKITRGCDDGYVAPLSCHWVAFDRTYGRYYVIAELYQAGLLPEVAAREIVRRDTEIERRDPYGELSINTERITGVIDSSAYADTGTGAQPRGNVMNRFGCNWEPCEKYPGSRVHRIQHLHRLLAFQKDGWPNLLVFNICPVLLKALPSAPRAANNPEDIDEGFPLMHAIDSVTYALSARDRSFRRVRLSNI